MTSLRRLIGVEAPALSRGDGSMMGKKIQWFERSGV
jgi:hypothetical protein